MFFFPMRECLLKIKTEIYRRVLAYFIFVDGGRHMICLYKTVSRIIIYGWGGKIYLRIFIGTKANIIGLLHNIVIPKKHNYIKWSDLNFNYKIITFLKNRISMSFFETMTSFAAI